MKSESHAELDELVSRLIDGQLTIEQSQRVETLLSQSPDAVTRYLELLDNHEALCAIYPGEIYADAVATESLAEIAPPSQRFSTEPGGGQMGDRSRRSVPKVLWAAAAAVLLTVGLAGYFLGSGTQQTARENLQGTTKTVVESGNDAPAMRSERTLAGHATLRRSFDLEWAEGTNSYHDGDVLPDGRIAFTNGVAEVEFFCGATLIVEGPAKFDIESDWSVHVSQGRLRAKVPPVARGFLVRTASGEIVDLGTEFALDVGPDDARVEVIDGEIELRGGQHDGEHLLTGQSRVLQGIAAPVSFDNLSTQRDLDDRRVDAASRRRGQWLSHTRKIAEDSRLIAYFPMIGGSAERLIYNFAAARKQSNSKDVDGVLIGPVEQSSGRFGPESAGLDFDRPGSRVRTQMDGEFRAFTFSCWAKIDSLDQIYNAIFMADGYENGEPHWQIHNDGRLMFSVMVDDSKGSRHYSEVEQRYVDTAGLARVYFSEPFWDMSKSGQWFHLAAVYDPAKREVKQFVNGELVGEDAIKDVHFIDQLRIGASEIGNWGQPFRKTPAFAVRNLNGTIDELAVYSAALTEQEIHDLFEHGRPLGY